MNAAEVVEDKRRRQVNAGFTVTKDVERWSEGELLIAAQCYITVARAQESGRAVVMDSVPKTWPLDDSWWHPEATPKANIGKAMGLLAAEWDRLHFVRQ